MGADGGVVWISLKNPSDEKYARVIELLSPFWQFLSRNSGSSWGEDANYQWECNNPTISAPNYILGYYGTDHGDNFELGDLPNLCEPTGDSDWKGYLHNLTFDELDMSCRTSPREINGHYDDHVLERLWYRHFHFYSREETLEQLGSIVLMTAEQWADELKSLLDLNHICREETWT